MSSIRLFKFSLFIRLIVILLQVIFNRCVPDHNADAFRLPYEKGVGAANSVISYLFEGFGRWDAQYFLHISLYGYTHENTLAFFPLFPVLLRNSCTILSIIFPFELSPLNCALLSDVFSNIKCFPYFLHIFFATIFCILFIHIQVVTRMLCSSSPILYWVATTAILPGNERARNQRTVQTLCKTSLTWNTDESQLNNGGGRWSTPAAMHVQRFVSPVLPDRLFCLHSPNFIVRGMLPNKRIGWHGNDTMWENGDVTNSEVSCVTSSDER
ncbi:GPI mannosyltransferase 2 [Trichonephila clavipes]|nr:GPI mannosyltransferase 2 [Trichonephila clavipes]